MLSFGKRFQIGRLRHFKSSPNPVYKRRSLKADGSSRTQREPRKFRLDSKREKKAGREARVSSIFLLSKRYLKPPHLMLLRRRSLGVADALIPGATNPLSRRRKARDSFAAMRLRLSIECHPMS